MPRKSSNSTAGLKLRCRSGHWEFASFELSTTVDADLGTLFGMVARCDFGDHWLERTENDTIAVSSTPYYWHTASDAFAALTRYEAQDRVAD